MINGKENRVYTSYMYHEIDRRFLVQKMPSLKKITPVIRERHFLQHGDLVEEWVQKKDGEFEYEIKTAISPREWAREKRSITEKEFKELVRRAPKTILCESYFLSEHPRILIKRYKGEFRGLDVAEVEFDTLAESGSFAPLEWMGTEITHLPLGRDARLLDFDREHFLRELKIEYDKLNGNF